MKASPGGVTPEGESERFEVNLLEEELAMPSAARARDIGHEPSGPSSIFHHQHVLVSGTCAWRNAL